MFSKGSRGYFSKEITEYTKHAEESQDGDFCFDYVIVNLNFSEKMQEYKSDPILMFIENGIELVQ